jgi:hypothetical protein
MSTLKISEVIIEYSIDVDKDNLIVSDNELDNIRDTIKKMLRKGGFSKPNVHFVIYHISK